MTAIDDISIHSLVKRETVPAGFDYQAARISIHSLVKRETEYVVVAYEDDDISIHSLVKRETPPERLLLEIIF